MSHRPALPRRMQGLPRVAAAFGYAQRAHGGQVRRIDGEPFIRHPIEVATLLHDAGAAEHVVVAGLLHDVLEKTSVSAGTIRARFGHPVAGLVLAVSEDPAIEDFGARKAGLRDQVAAGGDDALLLFAADKISKVREFRREFLRPATPRARRLDHYRRSLDLLEARLPSAPLVLCLREELDPVLGRWARHGVTARRRVVVSPVLP